MVEASWGLPKTSNIGPTLKYKTLGAPCKKTSYASDGTKAPKVFYLRVVTLLDVLGSPQEAPNISLVPSEAKEFFAGSPHLFVFESSADIGCFREPPGSPTAISVAP